MELKTKDDKTPYLHSFNKKIKFKEIKKIMKKGEYEFIKLYNQKYYSLKQLKGFADNTSLKTILKIIKNINKKNKK